MTSPVFPPCPKCGTLDYDVDFDTYAVGYCILKCGAVFDIVGGKAVLRENEEASRPHIYFSLDCRKAAE